MRRREVCLGAEVGEECMADEVALAELFCKRGRVAEAQAVAGEVYKQEERLTTRKVRKQRKQSEKARFRTETLLGIYI